MDIRGVWSILSKASPRAFQPEIIQNRFKFSDVFPFDENAFGEDEFLTLYPINWPSTSDALNSEIRNQTCDADLRTKLSMPQTKIALDF